MLFCLMCTRNIERPVSLAIRCAISSDFNTKLLNLRNNFSTWTQYQRKYLVLCINRMVVQNLSSLTCRNCWSYSRDAFSPFCSKFKTCCFSDSGGNCCSWSKAVSHPLQPQPLLLFSFTTAEKQGIPQSAWRDESPAKSSPNGSWGELRGGRRRRGGV